jgi:diguanylate cyclase (GGDEF)-like protein
MLVTARTGSLLIAVGRRALAIAPVVAAGFLAFPVPAPTPAAPTVNPPLTTSVLPSVLPTALPTPSLPVSVSVSPPSLNGVSLSPSPAATGAPNSGGGGGAVHHNAGQSVSPATATTQPGLTIPFTSFAVASPLDIALIGALATLPLLLGIWLFAFGRTLAEARRAREAHIKLTLAADLGLKPRELTGMSAKTLFNLREKAAFDELTGVLRRAAGISVADREIARARRHQTPLAVAFIDVDGLQEANDKEGHQAGDQMLRTLARALQAGLRSQDVVFRYAGDEFVCVLPDTTFQAGRAKLGRIQDELARVGLRFCVGVAELERPDDVVSLFARADRELYEFKAKRGEIVQLPPAGAVKRRRQGGVTS